MKLKTKEGRGITLIALVITIIVLLILAGVSIATLTGENGILTRADNAKTETTKEEARERIQLETAASFDNTGKYDKELAKFNLKANLGIADADIKDNGEELKVILDGYEFKVDEKGQVDEGTKVGGNNEPQVPITDYVKVGQYVDYEPTKTDVNKTQSVEASKLTYTSPVGGYSSTEGIITHGNGNSEQTFTAKVNDGTSNGMKWRVLSVSDDKVELISDTVVRTDANANFLFKGGIGYLYAEQELNEACKIYGYGYGADKSIETSYTVGGPEDIPVIGKITQSGARSITIEDLNKKAGIYEDEVDGKMKYRDGTKVDSEYGSTSNPTTAVYYPTLSSSNTTYPGQSSSKKTNFKNTSYYWEESEITDTKIQSMLFNGNYWLASRCINTASDAAGFFVYYVSRSDADTSGTGLCGGKNSRLDQYYRSFGAVRPVVTLKSNVIDINTDYDAVGEWKLK